MSAIARAWDSDLAYSFRRSPTAVLSAIVALICIVGAVAAPVLAPYNPFDLASLDLMDAFNPPAFMPEGSLAHPIGTDDQGRDVLSAIMYGARMSLFVGVSATAFSLLLGVLLGLLAGYAGGTIDAVLMRIADVQLTFPNILIALLVDGVARAALPRDLHDQIAVYVVIFAIGISDWPRFARTVRGSAMVERNKEYVLAARVIGIGPARIMLTHVLPNVLGPLLVLATLNLGLAIISEATLSFLGVGLPQTQPSLGTLIRVGNDFLFSGEWWITVFPGVALIAMVLSVNLLGDWLRDALNPRLR
ncbi:ABC transporter permease [Roseomonas sp. KE2513]|uniref:ABC transporter permease n=1 Tax=Roseomonas sp. KE2513 TaxID=2479202 RepID=UPI0018DF4D04|nr:ABC transporter permease [Roseomonas sp. KE2513]MBI0534979.1 ABC transporter permease [Roseomonas sp. KE2513]